MYLGAMFRVENIGGPMAKERRPNKKYLRMKIIHIAV
jgi:hypothetical protein